MLWIQSSQYAHSHHCEAACILQKNDLDRAVELFGIVLQTRCQKYGGQLLATFRFSKCPVLQHQVCKASMHLSNPQWYVCCDAEVHVKCASTYFRYGAALFYKAQDEQDVFGAPLQAAAADTLEAAEAEDDESGKTQG